MEYKSKMTNQEYNDYIQQEAKLINDLREIVKTQHVEFGKVNNDKLELLNSMVNSTEFVIKKITITEI